MVIEMYSREEVEKANIELSKVLADRYNETEPHYRPENKAIVKAKLKELQKQTNGTNLLDMGCGTGFIIDIADGIFKSIHGTDISKEMLDKVRLHNGVTLYLVSSEALGGEDNTYDVCTAYSLLHHLHNPIPTLKEAYRVLRPGGIFWSALDPNYYFLESIRNLCLQQDTDSNYSGVINREINELRDKKGKKLFLEAEPLKYQEGGFKEEELSIILRKVGFSNWKIEYYWFLGEREYIHKQGSRQTDADIIRPYLKDILPLSRHLFKYLSITAVK